MLPSGELEKVIGVICFPSLCLCSRSFPRPAEPALPLPGSSRAGPAASLTPPPKGKLIKLMIQGSFIQNLPFLLEALIKTIVDQSAAKHLIWDEASSPPHPGFCSHPFEVSSSLLHRQHPGPGREEQGTGAAEGTLHRGTGVTIPIREKPLLPPPLGPETLPLSQPLSGARSTARDLSPHGRRSTAPAAPRSSLSSN